jgi:pimeloyl-ACP methyl ester carboxylesterase
MENGFRVVSRALRDVGDTVGPVHGLVGHSLGGAAVSLAMRHGLAARRVMRQNLESRLQIRWEELHIPTLARSMTSPALIVHDVDDPDVPYAHGAEIARAWPAAELFTTRGLGHRTILRDPGVVRRTVDFLRAGVDG